MPPRLRLDVERSIPVSLARLTPKYGCGLMLKNLPKFDMSDPMQNIMDKYGYKQVYADPPAQRVLENSDLLRTFYQNAFEHKASLASNFRQVYGERDMVLACDPKERKAWFVSEPQNRIALVNYFRDAVSLGLRAQGRMLVGSTVKLTPVGWQNLHDLLSDDFIDRHKNIQRIEVLATFSGTRWREPCLGVGVTTLNFKEPLDIKRMAEAALRGVNGGVVET